MEFLAADALEGRETGTPGAALAANWVAYRFRRLGLQPVGPSFLQSFPAEPIHLDAERCAFSFPSPEGKTLRFSPGPDLQAHPGAPPGTAQGPLVFAGYGISAPEYDYDDLDGLDLQGAIALVFRWEPRAGDAEARFAGLTLTEHARLAHKVAELTQRGARAVLVASPPGWTQHEEAPGKLWWPADSQLFHQVMPLIRAQADPLDLAKTNFSPTDVSNQFFSVLQAQGPLQSSVPVVFLGQDLLRSLFAAVGQDPTAWVQEVDMAGAGNGFPLGIQAELQVHWQAPRRLGRNVVALLPGSDPAVANEIVLVSAHYDHVGQSTAGEIWNGADDNASGIAGLLAIAESLAQDPPRRPVLFLATDAEELGLLGAAHFLAGKLGAASNLDKVVRPCAALNLDMIGRSRNGEIQILGSHSSPEFARILETALEGLGLHPDLENEEFFERSDQAVFYRAGIPVLFLNTGEHPDYHTPQDTADRLHYSAMSAITVLARRLTQQLANAAAPPPFEDGYARLVPIFGRSPRPILAWSVKFEDRLDF